MLQSISISKKIKVFTASDANSISNMLDGVDDKLMGMFDTVVHEEHCKDVFSIFL